MTRKKRYLFSYLLLALALVVLFAANLFWGSVALTPGAVLAALKAGTIQPSRHQRVRQGGHGFAAAGRTHCRWASSPSCACPGP